MTFDSYAWLRALHVAAAITFVAGVLSAAVFLAATQPGPVEKAWVIYRWDRAVTTPAMLLVWTFGLTLALMGGWFHDGWLLAKLVFVVTLSGVHGVQSAKLRRLAGGVAGTVSSRLVAPLVLGLAMAITILVVAKPL